MKGYSRNYDVIVVGGGPAGAFFAYEMLQRYPDKQILLIERGKRVEKRFCPANDEKGNGKCVKCKPHCNITNGFSGAGAFSDGKLSLYNPEDDDFYVGGNLHKYVGVEETKKLIDYTDGVYLKFGATKDREGISHRSKVAKIRKDAENVGVDLINIPIRHLGTDNAHELYQKIEKCLENGGVNFLFETEVTDLIIQNNEIKGVEFCTQNESESTQVYAEKVVVAVGRVGADWFLNMCEKHSIKASPAIIDVGVRYELPNKIMEKINEYLYEGKFTAKPNPFNDKIRTFCQNPKGFVSVEIYDGGIACANGHSMKHKKSENTNLALLVSLNLRGVADPMEYSRNIARNMNALGNGNILVQRLGDLKAGKRTWEDELEENSVKPTLKSAVAGDISLAMPYREMTDILSFIELMDKIVPGFANDDNLLYGPEIKFYSNKVDLTENFETSINGLHAIGDGCGLTRGLMMASASGVQLARTLYD